MSWGKSFMARLPRLIIASQPLQVTHHGNNRQAVFFFREEDYERLLPDLAESAVKYGCQIHANVLMTNHLLLTPLEVACVSGMMQAVGSSLHTLYQYRKQTQWNTMGRSV